MKIRLLLAAATLATATNLHAAPPAPIQGQVLEVMNVEGYTYLRLKTVEGETWAAVPSADVKKGAQVTLAGAMPMENFESKTLKRKFDRIYFATLAGGGAASAGSGSPHGTNVQPSAVVAKVPKATDADAKTVAELVSGRTALKDKTVSVSGQVVKVNSGILGKTWLHLQDGSGSPAAGTHDVIVTTTEAAAVGDVLTARGTVRTDVTVGAGYAYPVLVEDAKLRR
jgi:hypothetical protein